MSTERNDGGPAFPCDEIALDTGGFARSSGMSLRDYFAAKAMQGLLPARHPAHCVEDGEQHLAQDAYLIADAMLKARDA